MGKPMWASWDSSWIRSGRSACRRCRGCPIFGNSTFGSMSAIIPDGLGSISYLCDRAIAVWIAQAFFSLPYRHASISFGATTDNYTLNCRRWGFNKGYADYAWRPVSLPKVSAPGSLEFHLLERYRFFTERRGILQEGCVSHAPYEASKALFSKWSALPLAWNGLPIPDRPPDLAHYCRGVSVEAHALTPVRALKAV